MKCFTHEVEGCGDPEGEGLRSGVDMAEARGLAKGLEQAALRCDAERPHAAIAGDLAIEIRALHPDPSLLVVKREDVEYVRMFVRYHGKDTGKAAALLAAMLGEKR